MLGLKFFVGPLATACLIAHSFKEAHADIKIGLAGPGGWSVQVKGAEKAIQAIETSGGLLGQELTVVSLDDQCSAEMAVLVARQMVELGVDVVMGHVCSGASIAASAVYEDAKILMISCCSTSPQLTEQGQSYIFRVAGRDDHQARMAGDYVADNLPGQRIAILDNGQAFRRKLIEEIQIQLRKRGQKQLLYIDYEAGERDYHDVIERLEEFQPDVLYVAGRVADTGLIVLQSKERFPHLKVFASDNIANSDFAAIAGEASEGVMFTFGMPEAKGSDATKLISDLTEEIGVEPEGYVFHAYASVQAWSEAVRQTGSVDADVVSQALRDNQFSTVLGTIGFNEKGDVTGIEPFYWYVFKSGHYEILKE
ncbi:branched-chain amino acid ABC transporter substrate-binding protein [Ruegeria sp. SCP11]|uniref:branched-chain amino acid ABC transporter substrate-binding protein n=1 Tax=Ruegeria sp. SCP11 TaxID=3141378 RepID=UPI00333B11F7